VGDALCLPGDRQSPPLEAVVNPVTAGWYLDALASRAWMLQICVNIDVDSDAVDTAMAELASILASSKRPSHAAMLQRLDRAVLARTILIDRRHWRDTSRWQRPLRLSAYYFVAGDLERSRLLLGIPTYSPDARLNAQESDIATILGSLHHQATGDTDSARQMLSPLATGRRPLTSLAQSLVQSY
jgi:hypothetical protein